LSSLISIDFDIAMNENLTEDAFTFYTLDQSYQGSFNWDNESTSFDFTPNSNLIHNTNYLIQLSTDTESAEGANLENQSQTSFTTRDFRSSIIFTGAFVAGDRVNQGGNGSIAINPNDDSVHVSFEEEDSNGIYYLTCTNECEDNTNWSDAVAIYDNINDMSYNQLKLDSNNDFHLMVNETTALKYVNCTDDCSDSANWTGLDLGVDIGVSDISLFIDNNDEIHISYADNNLELYYGSCAANCTNLLSWDLTKVYDTNIIGTKSSIKKSSNDSMHISFVDDINNLLMYATCDDNCTDTNNWDTTSIEIVSNGTLTDIEVDSNNGVHIAYLDDGSNDVRHSTCSANCTNAANWNTLTLTNTANYSTDVAPQILINSSDVIMILHSVNDAGITGELNYLVCESGCDNLANWSLQNIYDGDGLSGQHPKAALGVDDKLHIISFDETGLGDGIPDLIYSD
jgi:hypothetical protein